MGRLSVVFAAVAVAFLSAVSAKALPTLTVKRWESGASSAQASKQARPGRTFRDCAACPEMVVVPAGSFTMGSPASEPGREEDEGEQRRVTFARDFAVGRFEVTRGQYAAFTSATGRTAANECRNDRENDGDWAFDPNGTWRDPGFTQTDDHPVVCVSMEDAEAYVQWLNTQTRGGYRLLSEAEWEYAARAGSTTAYPWGDTASRESANYGTDWCCLLGFAQGRDAWLNTSPVGQFPANAFGLSDMIGNAWEWTSDCYERSADGAGCDTQAGRGGGWDADPQLLRSANRDWYLPDVRYAQIGFRVAKS